MDRRQSTDDELTPEQWRFRLATRPYPQEGEPPWSIGTGESAYEVAAESLARALLKLVDERPELLNVPSKADDPQGFARADNDQLWEAFQERWPGGNDWLGGITWFQYGWAHNIVRYIVGAEPVGNPAIIELG